MLFRFWILSLLLLGACASSDKTVSNGKILRANLATEPPTLDLRKVTDATSNQVLLNIYEGLTRITPDEVPKPALAKKISITKEGRVYTFKLRPSKWSNGEPLTAHDFLRTWLTILDPKFPAPFAYKFFIIKNAKEVKSGVLPPEALGVKVIDNETLKVKLTHPAPYFLELTSFPLFFPKYSDESEELVSNGPFKLKKWAHESEIRLEKNPLYWDADSVHLDGVHLTMVEDTTTEFYMFEMGELDWCGSPLSNLPSEIVPALKQESKLHCYPVSSVYYYVINTTHPYLSNKHLRRALGLAINRDEIVKHILQAEQVPALSLVPQMPGREKAATFFQDGNAAEARDHFQKALEELKVSKEEISPLILSYNSNREHQKVAQAIQNQWKAAFGLQTQLETYDWKVYLAKIATQDYQVGRMGWVGDFNDPVSFLAPFKTLDLQNVTGWHHPRYQELLDEAAATRDSEKRQELLLEAEGLLIEEMPVIPLFYIIYCYLKKPYVNNVFLSSLGTIDFKWATVDR